VLQDVVSTEHLRSGFTVEGEREIYLHRIAFQMLSDTSLDPAVASRARNTPTCWFSRRTPPTPRTAEKST
jgi:hypothetical protein